MSLSTPGTERTQRIILQGLIVVSFVFFVTTVLAASTAQEMYAAAMAREETVRAALAEKDGDVDVGVAASARAVVAPIKNIRREVLSDAVRITIELDHEVAFHDERIPDPVRVFVDLPSTRPAPALLDKTLRFDGDTAIVRQIRIGRHPNATTRV